jgi:hypothetical protein
MAKNPGDRYPSSSAFVDALAGGVAANPSPRATASALPAARAPSTVKIPQPAPAVRRAAAPSRSVSPAQREQHRSMWPVAVLLLLVGGLGGVIVVQQRDAAKAAVAPVAVTPSLNADSIAAADRAQLAENAELRKEVADARRIALDAEQKMEQLSKDRDGTATAAAKRTELAHLFVMTRGGTPGVVVDGRTMADASPAVIEVSPGRHTVQVKGGGVEFFPAEYSIDVTANDTTNLTFVSKRVAQQNAFRGRPRSVAGDGSDAAAQAAGTAPDGGARTPDPAKMTPEQLQRWQAFQRAKASRQAQRRP